ncbi:hypothetical protein CcaverHIS002_0409700 [Cutaneotrichosporon cavernicola]|uniref:Uncharacterized protein n=1 Tax=Cutaneotrichosporon cavernicola TaxID=279322 RepID=A0AA48L552_9TREE|nr:uncharacterized protein CcaverHIS019_0409620 [Cutaneotrichosporon cavernicola]BEI84366.1 hypothetical protein CcaverHIS002_0409700 [Cutaneotrichosporon cavernicola]BEI92142.1 hypothetical protein CcaverHIS019_0409620 [Cutaneotrichosporon cavernicola]BEI99912.1 hypothetical protein CcaverHIS631_0409550 [Cutaneotrichosporon cavernicola]BEJ07687.1 hypothetical protein CcaverHIS641_0409560 [Cutaneotrichosporon cavernicola]
MSPPERRSSIDATMFPTIMDTIISHADRPTRFAVRATSKEHRDRVDAALCAHLSLFADGRISLTMSDGQTVPCVRAVAPGGERVPGLKWSAYEAEERERFLALLRHTRVLELEGRAGLHSVGHFLTGVRTVRCRSGRESHHPLPFAYSTLESEITLQCQPDIGIGGMRWRQPPVAEAALAPSLGNSHVWRVTVRFDPEEPGLSGARIGLRAPTSVRHVMLDFRPLEPGELRRSRDAAHEPRELGMLADVIAMAAHCIDRAHFTIALDARRFDPAWVSWPRDEMAAGELKGAVYRAVRRVASDVIGDPDGIEAAMRRFRFESELADHEPKAML